VAITWDVTITSVNLQSKRATVSATRTDSESALPSRAYTLANHPLETQADRTQTLDTIKEWDEQAVTKEVEAAAFIDNLEQLGKANLETWELTR